MGPGHVRLSTASPRPGSSTMRVSYCGNARFGLLGIVVTTAVYVIVDSSTSQLWRYGMVVTTAVYVMVGSSTSQLWRYGMGDGRFFTVKRKAGAGT